jgi:hypothetical protein
MNSSQLLYKISNLTYAIRRKEVEYTNAVKAGDQLNMDLHNAALALLKEDLTTTVETFNSVPVHSFDNKSRAAQKTRWWQNLFHLKAAINKK